MKAEGGKGGPERERKHLAKGRGTAGRVQGGIGEKERSEKADGRIEEWKDIRPSNVGSRVRGSSGVEKDTVAKLYGGGGSGGETMPKQPPAAGRIREGCIVGVTAQEMAIVVTIGGASGGGKEGLRKVDLDEIPTRS